jgi:hypothetical protein
MPQFLFIVEVPASKAVMIAGNYPPEWIKFCEEAETIVKPHKGSSKLQLNSWLIPADHAWPIIEGLSRCATDQGLTYAVALISDVALILTAPFKS